MEMTMIGESYEQPKMSRHVLGKVYCFECNLKREEGEEIKECPDQITGK